MDKTTLFANIPFFGKGYFEFEEVRSLTDANQIDYFEGMNSDGERWYRPGLRGPGRVEIEVSRDDWAFVKKARNSGYEVKFGLSLQGAQKVVFHGIVDEAERSEESVRFTVQLTDFAETLFGY